MAWPASIIGGANIHTFVFTNLKNNRFQKKLMTQNTLYEYSPLQLSTLATPLERESTPRPNVTRMREIMKKRGNKSVGKLYTKESGLNFFLICMPFVILLAMFSRAL